MLIVYYGSVFEKNSYFFGNTEMDNAQTSKKKKKKDLHIIEYLTVYHRFYILFQIACNSHKNESKVLYKIQC